MSHQDAVSKLPSGFQTIASTKDSKLTIIENTKKNIYALSAGADRRSNRRGI